MILVKILNLDKDYKEIRELRRTTIICLLSSFSFYPFVISAFMLNNS